MTATAPIIAAVLAAASARADVPPPPVAASTCPSTDAPDAPHRTERIGRLGVGGAALALAGLGTTIGGGVILARGNVVENEMSSVVKTLDYRPLGGTLIGVGVGAFAIGVTALAIDVVSRAKRRRRSLTIGPSFGPRMTAVTVSARF